MMGGDPVGWDHVKPSPVARWLPALVVIAAVVALAFVGLRPTSVEGVVVAVDSAGLGKVNGFDLRLPDGTTLTLKLGVLENATQFSPAHLAEHMASSERVRVFYRNEAGVPTAYRIEDAST